MNALNTTKQRRAYLQEKLDITDPLSQATMERIAGNTSFDMIHKLELSLCQATEELDMTPESISCKTRIADIEQSIACHLEHIPDVLKDITREEGERAIKQAKAKALLQDAIQSVNDLCEKLNADANKYGSRPLAELSTCIKTAITR